MRARVTCARACACARTRACVRARVFVLDAIVVADQWLFLSVRVVDFVFVYLFLLLACYSVSEFAVIVLDSQFFAFT